MRLPLYFSKTQIETKSNTGNSPRRNCPIRRTAQPRRYAHIGDVLARAGRREEALAAFEKSRAISQKLVDADPTNTDKRLFARGCIQQIRRRVSGMDKIRGGACCLSKEPRNHAEGRQRRAPSNSEWQVALGVCYGKIGDVRSQQDAYQEAITAYQNELAIEEKLVGSDRDNSDWQRRLGLTYRLISRRSGD